jgi:hypothetical protein
MNNDADRFGSFWFWLAVVSNYCQIESYELNKKQISNDELLKYLEHQDNDYLRTIIEQNIQLIEQNNIIIQLLKGGKSA